MLLKINNNIQPKKTINNNNFINNFREYRAMAVF